MHAFDRAKINGSIEVRNAKSGEKVELLNEATVELKEDTLVIADNELCGSLYCHLSNSKIHTALKAQ
jgi:phenylalanyl-tRNA synthetase beta subunit